MRVSFVIAVATIVLISVGCSEKEPAPAMEQAMISSPSETFISEVLACLSHSRTIMDNISEAADEAAERMVAGGKIYVLDDETLDRTGEEETKNIPGGGFNYPMHEDWGGFVAEACDRAGGLRHIQPVPLDGNVTDNDVIIAATLDLDPKGQQIALQGYMDKGVLVILFGSANAAAAETCDYLIDNGLAPGIIPVMDVGRGEKIGPVAGLSNVINMWTFTSELVAALTRQGKMPTLWQSMFLPGAAKRNQAIENVYYHDDMRIMPIEPGILGRQFLTAVTGYLEDIKRNEIQKFKEAGMLLAGTLESDNTVVLGLIGHFMTSQRRMAGFPDVFTVRENLYGSEQLEGVLTGKDVWLHIGYSYYPIEELEYAKKIGAKTVCVFTDGPTSVGEGKPVAPDLSFIDIYIDPYWQHGDAVVEVPDYDTKIIPPSGVVMVSCLWMLIGEMLQDMNN